MHTAKAATTAELSRPFWTDTTQNRSRSLTVSDNEFAFPTANPDLQPEYATHYDTRIEYFFEPVVVFSAGFFYKEIKDAQISTTSLFTAGDVPQDILDLGFTESGARRCI